MTEQERDWQELTEKEEKSPSHEEKMKYRMEYMKKWCTGSLEGSDPDDDTVMLAGVPTEQKKAGA